MPGRASQEEIYSCCSLASFRTAARVCGATRKRSSFELVQRGANVGNQACLFGIEKQA
jgi:hypothetical protein